MEKEEEMNKEKEEKMEKEEEKIVWKTDAEEEEEEEERDKENEKKENRKNKNTKEFKAGESEMCPYNVDIMTAEHLLQHCQLHDALRRDMWPEPTLLRDKLHGNLEELTRTAAFVRAKGLSV